MELTDRQKTLLILALHSEGVSIAESERTELVLKIQEDGPADIQALVAETHQQLTEARIDLLRSTMTSLLMSYNALREQHGMIIGLLDVAQIGAHVDSVIAKCRQQLVRCAEIESACQSALSKASSM